MFNELNKVAQSTVKENIILEDLEFVPLKNFIGKEVIVDGFFFTDGKFGKQVVVVGNGYKINMPARAVEDFEAIAKSESAVKAVLDGHLALTNIKTVNTKNGTTTAFKYTDR